MAAWMIPVGLSALSYLTGKRRESKAPQFPTQNVFQPTRDSQVYGPMGQDFARYRAGGTALTPQYREAVIGAGTRDLRAEQERAHQQNFEQMNKMGLLGSGALGVRGGLIDQQYARSLANIIDQLTARELDQYNLTGSRLMGIEGAQANQSMNLANMAYQAQAQRQQQKGANEQNLFANLTNAYQYAQMPQYLQALAPLMSGVAGQQPQPATPMFAQSPLGIPGYPAGVGYQAGGYRPGFTGRGSRMPGYGVM